MIYLDSNATTQPTEAAVQAVHVAVTTLWGNPSSVHRPGQEARHAVELARKELAALAGVAPKELVITSSGTESIDLAIRGVIESRAEQTGPKPNVVTTAIEHAAVRELVTHLESRAQIEARWLPLDERGLADPEALADLLDERTALVSIQWANNETGVIQPIERIAEICREKKIPLHCDGVQWIGKMPAPADPPCDLLTISAHKFHGPKGVGALWIRRGVGLVPQLIGTQETDRRGGTENVGAVVGAGVAAREAVAWLADPAARAKLAAQRDRFERAVVERFPDAVVNGGACPRLWNTSNIAFPGLGSEAMLMLLSERGLAASAGAACSSGSLEPSPVLLAMGIPDRLAHGSIRFSLCRMTTEDEIDEAIEIVAAAATQLAKSSSNM